MAPQAPQSLASIVESVESSQQSVPAEAPQKHSLQSAIDSVSAGQDVPTVRSEPVPADSHQQGQTSPVTTEAQRQANLRELLSTRGLNIPEELSTDEMIVESLVNEFDAAANVLDSPEYKGYLEWRSQQEKAPPAAVAPSAPETPDPQEILNAVRQGYVVFNKENQKWISDYPQFASYAETINEQDKRATQAKISLASDPEGYIAQKIKDAIASLKTSDESSDLKQLVEQIKQERIYNAEQSRITSWENANLAKLYVPVTGEMTAYGKAYQKFEAEISKANPSVGLLERHNQVLRQLSIIEEYLPKPSAQAVQAPKQTFLGAAERRNGNTNRLSNYSGPAANSVAPQIPKGKQGFPSLAGIIEQNATLATH